MDAQDGKHYSKEYFDKFEQAGLKRRLLAAIDRKEPVFSWMKRRFAAGSRLLDFGCGNGLFLKHAIAYFDCVGVDISEVAVERSKQVAPEAEVMLGNEATLEQFADEMFSVITAFDVFEHVQEPEVVWREMHRLLAHDGWLVLSVPQAESQMLAWRQQQWWGFEDTSHQWLISSWEWEGWLQRSGFLPVSVWPMGFINHPMLKYRLSGWQAGLHYATQALSLAGVRLPRAWSDVVLIVAVKNPHYRINQTGLK